MITSDKSGNELVHVMSEVGVTKILSQFAGSNDPAKLADADTTLLDSGRIGPGEMMMVDLKTGKLDLNDDLKSRVAKRLPYEKLIESSIKDLPSKPFYKEVKDFVNAFVSDEGVKSLALSKVEDGDYSSAVTDDVDDVRLITMQSGFGWGTEDVEVT